MTEKILPTSTLNLKPTPRQVRAITRMASQLGDRTGIEHTPVNRREARDLIFRLRIQLKEARNGKETS
ncbi:hypothetical protein LCGC14_0383330 [marine sediment metagenome]|uniref:Uncharacterized protein n=1 Tax=marine sediment metagenome TaxID=412755 RepID=A0A0F9T7K6_9ZZZZ